MIAEFVSECADCPAFIKPGEKITRGPDGWAHQKCPTHKVTAICPKCHMTKPCDCE